MSGATKLRKIQLGREAVLGTEVDATTTWRGTGTAEDQREKVFPDEHVGYLSRVDRSYEAFQGGGLELDSVEASYQQLLHILEMGVKTVAPVADGAGSDFISAYPLATSAKNAIKSYTAEAGNDVAEDVLLGTVCTDFKLEGSTKEAWKMSATLQSQQIADGSFTAAISIPAVQEILFQRTKLYIDAVGGTIGTTEVPSTIVGATLNVKTGVIPQFTGSGSLFYSHLEYGEPEVTLDLKLLHNVSGEAQKTLWRAGTPRIIRLESEGTDFASAGTDYSAHTMHIDVAGSWEKINKLGEEDGVDLIEGTFRCGYDSTATLFAIIRLVHELAAVA